MREVVIIGGGFAGLSAGVALAREGWRVRLLEQKPHLGGRARSFRESTTGSVVDNGQHLLMGCYHATRRFLDEIGTAERVAFQPRLHVDFLDAGGKLSSLDCPDLPAPWHLLAGVLRSSAFSREEKWEMLRLGRALDAGGAGGDGVARLSVEEWLGRLGQSESLRRKFWDLLCIAAMNEDPRIASAAIFERVLRLALFRSPEDSKLGIPRAGLSECYTEAARAYIESRGGKVEFNCRVAELFIRAGVCEGVRLSDGQEVLAEAVVCAAPWYEFWRLLPGDLLRDEPLFTDILTLKPAPIISINLWFDRPLTDREFLGLRGTTIQWLFNKGTILGTGENYVSIVLSGAHAHVGKSREDLLEMALAELRGLLPEARAARVEHALVLKERFATFSPSPEADAVRPTARTPVRGLVLAGDWTRTGLPATIEGAVQSGQTAARCLLQE